MFTDKQTSMEKNKGTAVYRAGDRCDLLLQWSSCPSLLLCKVKSSEGALWAMHAARPTEVCELRGLFPLHQRTSVRTVLSDSAERAV